VAHSLPSRPNLDHLRRQAKALLASLARCDADAVSQFQQFLPDAKDLTSAQVKAAGFRLADAQSAVARKNGFDAWPQLARHVEQLRSLEGAWSVARLEIDGVAVPSQATDSSRLLMDGDRFRMESPEATYEGVYNINVESQPHEIDIEFIEGPEAGKWNYGIFRLDGDNLEICLDMTGKSRPTKFRTSPGSGHACELWRRQSAARPASVSGGDRGAPPQPTSTTSPHPLIDASTFAYMPSETLTRLQGEWAAEKIVRDGKELMWFMRKTAKRSAKNNEVTISVMGQVMIHALVRINEASSPIEIDYYILSGQTKGAVQHGIMEWRGEDACFCMAPPGTPRPADFECPPDSGRTLSLWRPRP